MIWPDKLKKAVTRTVRSLSPNCAYAARLQSGAHVHNPTALQRLGLRIHLLLCAWCRRYGKQLSFLQHATHEHPAPAEADAPQTLSPEARERLKQSVRELPR